MGRILKRVPLDFTYPIGCVWEGYSPEIIILKTNKKLIERIPELLEFNDNENLCEQCDKVFNCCDENARHCVWHNEENKKLWFKEVPEGEGYQLWETTTEGSPKSPVFDDVGELADWCEKNATIFADNKIACQQWVKVFKGDEFEIILK